MRLSLSIPALLLAAGALSAASVEDLYGSWKFSPESIDAVVNAVVAASPQGASLPPEQKAMIAGMMKPQMSAMSWTSDANGTTMTGPNGLKQVTKSTITKIDDTHFKAVGIDPTTQKESTSNIEWLSKDSLRISGFKQQMAAANPQMANFPDSLVVVRTSAK